MNLLKLLPRLLGTAAKALGVDIDSAVRAIVGEQLTPEQQVALQTALAQHEREMKALSVEEMKIAVSESIAMIGSSDRFVSRARPVMLYAATAITCLLCCAVGYALVTNTTIELGAVGAIVSLMTPLWGAGGYYIHSRTKEKLNGNGQE